MARYRKIDTRIWNDQKFNKLSDDGKLVFLFVMTHQHLMPIGAMRTTIEGLASELHWELNRFQLAFDHVVSLSMIIFDDSSCLLWLPNFLKYNQPESPNVVKSYDEYLDYLPECELKNTLINAIALRIFGMSKAFREVLPKAFRKTIPIQEQEQEQEQEKKQSSHESNNSLTEDLNDHDKQQYDSYRAQAIEVLTFLNKKADKTFPVINETLNPIISRLKAGATVADCRQVIANKTRLWISDKKTKEWLRPMTLFNPDKFSNYIGELENVDRDEVNANT